MVNPILEPFFSGFWCFKFNPFGPNNQLHVDLKLVEPGNLHTCESNMSDQQKNGWASQLQDISLNTYGCSQINLQKYVVISKIPNFNNFCIFQYSLSNGLLMANLPQEFRQSSRPPLHLLGRLGRPDCSSATVPCGRCLGWYVPGPDQFAETRPLERWGDGTQPKNMLRF